MKVLDIRSKFFVVTLALSMTGWIAIARGDNPTPPGGSPSSSPSMTPPPAMQGERQSGTGGEGQGACREDVQKYCGNVQPGQGRIVGCLKQHQTELSQGCQSKMTEVKEKVKEKIQDIKQACQADLAQYCKDVQPGQGRLIHCLHEHHDQLSSNCQQAMKTMHHRRPGGPGGSEKDKGPSPQGQAPTGDDAGGNEPPGK